MTNSSHNTNKVELFLYMYFHFHHYSLLCVCCRGISYLRSYVVAWQGR